MLKEMEKNLIFNDTLTVLILILMEHAQRFTDLTLWNYLQSMS